MRRLLTDDEINKALSLKNEGLSIRKLSRLFEVGNTTIYENVYSKRDDENRKRYLRRANAQPTFRSIKAVIMIIQTYRDQGYTSQQVSQQFLIPLQDVNYIWTKNI